MPNFFDVQQWILFKCLDKILTFHQSDDPKVVYPNLILLDSDNPEVALNRIFAAEQKTSEFFLTLSDLQKAMLVPKVKLFRRFLDQTGAIAESEIEFKTHFDGDEFRNMVANPNYLKEKKEGTDILFEKTNGIGLQKITIEDKMETLSDVNLICTIELYLENVLSLNNSNLLALLKAPVLKRKFDPKDYRIRLVTGWQVPHGAVGAIFTPAQLDILESTSTSYLLELSNHALTFNNNGSVKLTLTYHGALEKYFSTNNECDIFQIDPDEDVADVINKDVKEATETIGAVASLTQPGGLSGKKAKILENMVLTAAGAKDPKESFASSELSEYKQLLVKKQQLEYLIDVLNSETAEPKKMNEPGNIDEADVEVKADYEERLKKINARIQDLESVIIKEKYAKLINEIMTKGRVFYLPVLTDVFQSIATGISLTSTGKTNDTVFASILAASMINVNPQPILGYGTKGRQMAFETFADAKKEILDDAGINTEEAKKLNKQEADQQGVPLGGVQYTIKDSGLFDPLKNYLIHYTTFGDILNAAVSFVKNDEIMRLIVGPCEIDDDLSKKIINLAQVPISLNNFSVFFINRVIKQDKRKYMLKDLISDMITDLVIPDITGPNINSSKKVNLNLTTSTVMSPKKLEKGVRYKDTEVIHYLSRVYRNLPEIYSYLLIYCYTIDVPKRIGNVEEDYKDGIFHFAIGRQKGIILNSAFNKVDQPKIHDVRLTGDSQNRPGEVLRERYNVQLNTIGNPLFQVGSMFFYDGAVFGLAGAAEAADILGLTGYYRSLGLTHTLSPGKWDMAVEGWWETEIAKNARPEIGGRTVINLENKPE